MAIEHVSLEMEDLSFSTTINRVPSVEEQAKQVRKKVESLMEQFEDEKNSYMLKLRKFSFFHYACKHGETDVVQYLVDRGEDVDVMTHDGVTPLFSACSEGHKDVVELLIKYGCNMNITATSGYHKGLNALYWAAFRGHIEVTEHLLKHGANPNVSDESGLTPLMAACREGHERVVSLLLQYGANLNACMIAGEYSGWTPLYFANNEGRLGVVRVLMETGADVICDKNTLSERDSKEVVSAQVNEERDSITTSPSRN